MEKKAHSCPDCDVEMESGFIPDNYAQIIRSDWHPGPGTDKTSTGNLKLDRTVMIPNRALDATSRSRLETVVEDLAQLERALHSFMNDHDGAPPEKMEELVPRYIDSLPQDPFANSEEKIPDYLKRHQRSLDGRGYLYLQKPGGTSIKSYMFH